MQKYFLGKLINVEYKLEEKKIFIKKLIYNAVQKTDSINKWNIQVSSLIYLLIINERIYKPNEIQKKNLLGLFHLLILIYFSKN